MKHPLPSVWRKLVFIGVLSPLLAWSWDSDRSLALDAQEQQIEITIRDSAFIRTKTMPIRPGFPTVIVIRNVDNIRHGFTSSMLAGLSVHSEGEGIESYGKGIDGFYVGPGETLMIRFITQQQGRFTF